MANAMPWPVAAGLGLAFVVVGAVVGRKALEQYGRAYRLLTTEVVDAADVSAGGTTAVSGAVEAREASDGVGSLFADDAVFCYTEAQVYESGGGGAGETGGWDTFHWNYEGVPFDVADETGSVGVYPPDCPPDRRTSVPEIEIDLPMESVTFESDEPAPDGVTDYIDRVDGFRRGADGGTLRFRQASLSPGDDVFVLGEATTGAAGPPTEVVVDGETNPGPFTISAEEGGSPVKNTVFGVFLTVFAVLGLGAGGYLLSLLIL